MELTRPKYPSNTPASWLSNVTYYDGEYRPIQTVRQLFDLGAAAVERVSILYKYDLAAVIAEQKTEQIVSTGTNSLLAVYSYDHNDRLLGVKETVGVSSKTKTAYTLAQRYNTLGQMQSKWFHAYSTNDSKYRVKTNHTNNIRGWLTGAESLYQKKIGESELPYYAFSLAYANGAVPASSNYTNGNISQMKWSGKDESTLTKGLNFEYDGADRLTESTGLSSYADTESGITYDKNGNIKTLQRAGVAIDNLTYSYNGNQLSGVNDASGNNSGVKNGGSNYSYDDNGNMTSDGNRGASISYNYLNLAKKVTIGSRNLVYDYDASGTKHKYYDLTAPDTVNIKYAGIFEYDGNNDLKRVITSSGQVQRAKVQPSPASDTLRFDYFLKDHLGNVRVVFDESGKILQRSDYYPYGLSISRDGALPANARNGINRYLYNGKELQIGTDFVDYGARMSMPEIGRWNAPDPLSEKFVSESALGFAGSNSVSNIDFNGMDYYRSNETGQVSWLNTHSKRVQGLEYLGARNTDQAVIDAVGNHIMNGGGWDSFMQYYRDDHFGEGFFYNSAKTYNDNASGFMKILGDNIPSIKDGTLLSIMTHEWVGNAGWTSERNQLEHNIGMFLISSKWGPGEARFIGDGNEFRGLFINDRQSGNMINSLLGRRASNGSPTAFEWSDLKENNSGLAKFHIFSKSQNAEKYSTYLRNLPKAQEKWQQIRHQWKTGVK